MTRRTGRTGRDDEQGWWIDAVSDLVTGSRCVGCGRAGRLLCALCADALVVAAAPAVIDPWPAGLGPVWSATRHDDVARALVIAHKERGQLALSRPLAVLLARAVAAALAAQHCETPITAGPLPSGPVLLCPVPPRPGSVRARGHDPTSSVVRRAARLLRGAGVQAYPAPLLVSRGTAADQGDLGAQGRIVNVCGTMSCPTARLRAVRRRHPAAWVVVCDDVVTTGSTLLEASRALAAVGVPVTAAATVTTTPRRSPSRSAHSQAAHRP